MKNNLKNHGPLYVLFLVFALSSCKKENSLATDSTAVDAAQAIAVAAGVTASAADSVYVVQTCSRGSHRDSIAFSSLPAAVTTYLSANYAGYISQKAFSVTTAAGTSEGYVVIIQFNGNPVGLKFDAAGNFVRVLEQREGRDLNTKGWREGGRFDNRDGRHRDTIGLSSLPAAILSYFTSNYPQDTLSFAVKNREGNYVLLSKNNGLFATIFTAAGTFVSRAQLPSPPGRATAIDASALPANAGSYLTTTYPGYVFDKAFSLNWNGTVQGYVVVIDSNNTKYAVQFDAAGNFVKAKTIR